MKTAPLEPLHLPLHGIRLIEASAGTGKTWTIAALYLRLVLGHGDHGQALLPPQILVVTFTKAATAELRDRIRTRLAEAAEAFRGRGAPDVFLATLIGEYPEHDARARAARQLDLAAQWMDEAAVYTIHGWCQRMLTQHAFDSGHAFVQDSTSDESELLTEAVHDYWRRHFFALDRDDVEPILTLWKNPLALQAALRPLLRHPADMLRLGGAALTRVDDLTAAIALRLQPLREARQRARALWAADAGAIEAQLAAALACKAISAATYKPATLAADLAALRQWSAGAADDCKLLQRYGQRKLAKATNKHGVTPQHEAFAAIDQLLDADQASETLKSLILTHALPWVAERVERAKEQAAQIGFDDMLTRLDRALHGASGDRLAQTIASQYPVALIDEFQDTDPLQWRIFQRIYAQRAGTGLLLIGDPKQAIYAFRGADIHTYLQARECAESPTWTLARNYRSTHAMVATVNRLFERAETFAHGAFGFGKAEGALPFLPVQAQGRRERLMLRGEPMQALQLAMANDDAPMARGTYQQLMAEHAAAILVDWLAAARRGECGFVDGEGAFTALAPGDVAILVRKGAEAIDMRRALRSRGVPSVYLSDRDSVYASAEAADLLLWLRACAEPGSDRAMRAALASATLGYGYGELDRLNLDERHWERSGERMRQLHDTWQSHGVLAMLHDLLHAFDLPARLLAQPDGERALTNLLHLAELLQHAAATLDGQHALIRHLATQINLAAETRGDTAEEKIVRLESEDALVKVITVHKAKGLEYPLVMLPFACGLRELKISDSFVWHDGDGNPVLDLQPGDAALVEADRERLQEDLRLLYVALTRARHACWVGIGNLKDGQRKTSGLHKSALGYVLGGGETLDEHGLAEALAMLQDGHPDVHLLRLPDGAAKLRHQGTEVAAPTRQARTYHGAPVEPWWIASYSALKVGDAAQPARDSVPETAQQDTRAEAAAEQRDAGVPAPTDLAPSIHTFPRGAEPGTFLHALLEWASDEGFAVTSPALAQLVEARCRRRGWQAWSPVLVRWLPGFLHTPLALPDGGQVALAEVDGWRAEMEFWFEAHRVDAPALDRLVTAHTLDAMPRPALLPARVNGMLKGFIDLVVEHDGCYFIVDYKSNWLGNDATAYTAEAMRDSVLHSRYDLQYAIYTLALHRQLRARLPGYDYAQHVGGVMYLYVRGVDGHGHGVHSERLPLALVEAMDRLFATGDSHDA